VMCVQRRAVSKSHGRTHTAVFMNCIHTLYLNIRILDLLFETEPPCLFRMQLNIWKWNI